MIQIRKAEERGHADHGWLNTCREEMGGNWYKADRPPAEGWLCPALYHYFEEAPAELYVKAESLK